MAKKGRLTNKEREQKKEYAKMLFLQEKNISIKELAERVGVAVNTASEWIKSEKWEGLKRNILLTRQEQLVQMQDELAEINAYIQSQEEGYRFADYKTAQIRNQLIKNIKDLETKALLPEMINALTQFLDFVRVENLDDAQLLADYTDAFIKSKL
ncbi:transcriptional regulator [Ornithobacterium rhinotracheale]|uniref:Helix-turn-helix protein n=2 Tax=Ornithobacterium rhinotracheale TaxID=28251 RepID=I4A091_ORNRL|nr:DNA-binding protein [Ornithobacterium rhinotracheale]AFL97375.1 Helix-turn-helix protein [Ornithobacterium rhinotracheale DSM 15997]MRI63652.1 transcriptional regulator [Ornithobacterium rhinotracheale]